MFTYATLQTPVGELLVSSAEEKIVSVFFEGPAAQAMKDAWPQENSPVKSLALAQLEEYFAGIRTEFILPLAPPVVSDFQAEVHAGIAKIPYGETLSYKNLAIAIGRPQSVRAIGNACGVNPLPIIVPCHRVVGHNDLGGFSGGIERKQVLLAVEQS